LALLKDFLNSLFLARLEHRSFLSLEAL